MAMGTGSIWWCSRPAAEAGCAASKKTDIAAAYASGYRHSEAPMRAITKGLPKQPKKDRHFAAMPYDRVAAFLVKLREKESFSRLALEFVILTAARSGEVRGRHGTRSIWRPTCGRSPKSG